MECGGLAAAFRPATPAQQSPQGPSIQALPVPGTPEISSSHRGWPIIVVLQNLEILVAQTIQSVLLRSTQPPAATLAAGPTAVPAVHGGWRTFLFLQFHRLFFSFQNIDTHRTALDPSRNAPNCSMANLSRIGELRDKPHASCYFGSR